MNNKPESEFKLKLKADKAALLARAPNASYKDLEKEFTRWSGGMLRAIMSDAGVGIGIRENYRADLGKTKVSFKQIEVLASILAHPSQPNFKRGVFSEIGERHKVSREYVSQIHVKAKMLGIIK